MIIIEGTVGAGKTTLMNIMEEKGYVAFREPVKENPYLEDFYKDRRKYAFATQLFLWNERVKLTKNASKTTNSIMDRSIYGDDIFAEVLYKEGSLSRENYVTLNEYKDLERERIPKPKLLIYLEIETDEAIKRINKRDRDCELNTGYKYWDNINNLYKSKFKRYNESRMLKINVTNLDFLSNEEDREYILNLIDKEIRSIEE